MSNVGAFGGAAGGGAVADAANDLAGDIMAVAAVEDAGGNADGAARLKPDMALGWATGVNAVARTGGCGAAWECASSMATARIGSASIDVVDVGDVKPGVVAGRSAEGEFVARGTTRAKAALRRVPLFMVGHLAGQSGEDALGSGGYARPKTESAQCRDSPASSSVPIVTILSFVGTLRHS